MSLLTEEHKKQEGENSDIPRANDNEGKDIDTRTTPINEGVQKKNADKSSKIDNAEDDDNDKSSQIKESIVVGNKIVIKEKLLVQQNPVKQKAQCSNNVIFLVKSKHPKKLNRNHE
eukprot:2194470-Ditylum_brightwellii.AAC.1